MKNQLHIGAQYPCPSPVNHHVPQSKIEIQKSKMQKNSLFQSNSKAFKEKFSHNPSPSNMPP